MLLKKYLLVNNFNYRRYKRKTSPDKGDWKKTVCGDCKHAKDDGSCKLFDPSNRGFCGLSIVRKIFSEIEIKKLKEKAKTHRMFHFYSPDGSQKVR